jgi:hypothetical protein
MLTMLSAPIGPKPNRMIKFNVEDRVGTIVIERASAGNAFTEEMVRQLGEIGREFGAERGAADRPRFARGWAERARRHGGGNSSHAAFARPSRRARLQALSACRWQNAVRGPLGLRACGTYAI